MIPLSTLPALTFLGVVALLFGIITNLYNGSFIRTQKDNIYFYDQVHYGNLMLGLVGLLFLSAVYITRMFGDINGEFTVGLMLSNTGSIFLHALFFIFLVNTRKDIQNYLKIYVYFVFIMASCAILADLLLMARIVDPFSGFININEWTNGSFTRDEGVLDSYIFPYYLSFIITNGGKLGIAGLEFFRITGWAHEPTSYSLFIMPALILLISTKIVKSMLIRIFVFLTILGSWFLAGSVGSWLAVLILAFFVIALVLYTKNFPFRLTLIIFISALSVALLIFVNYDILYTQSTLLSSKFKFESETVQVAYASLTWYLPNWEADTASYYAYLFIWCILVLFLGVVLRSLIVDKKINIFAIILLYVIIHSMKGSQTSVFTLVFVFFWFYLAYFSTNSGKKYLNTIDNKKE